MAAMSASSNAQGASSTTTTPTRRSTRHRRSEGSSPGGRPASWWGRAPTGPGPATPTPSKAFTTRLGLVWSGTLDGPHVVEPGVGRRRGQRAAGRGRGHRHRHPQGRSGCSTGPPGRRSGTRRWSARVIGSVVTADLTGDGYQDLLVPTIHGVEVLDGRSGAEVTVLGRRPRLPELTSGHRRPQRHGGHHHRRLRRRQRGRGAALRNPRLRRRPGRGRGVVANVPPRPGAERDKLGLARRRQRDAHGPDGPRWQRPGVAVLGRALGHRARPPGTTSMRATAPGHEAGDPGQRDDARDEHRLHRHRAHQRHEVLLRGDGHQCHRRGRPFQRGERRPGRSPGPADQLVRYGR